MVGCKLIFPSQSGSCRLLVSCGRVQGYAEFEVHEISSNSAYLSDGDGIIIWRNPDFKTFVKLYKPLGQQIPRHKGPPAQASQYLFAALQSQFFGTGTKELGLYQKKRCAES